MYKYFSGLYLLAFFQVAFAAGKIDIDSYEKILNQGKIYNIQVLYVSEKNSKKEHYTVVHYGGYYMGHCNENGPCGCGTIGNVSWLQLTEKNEIKKIETKTVYNSCSNSELDQFVVKYNKNSILIAQESNHNLVLKYFLNKSQPEVGFQVATDNAKVDTSAELNNSYVGEEKFTGLQPGFSCKNSRSYIEKQICNSVELSELDLKMTDRYKKLLKIATDIEVSSLKAEQMEFINYRNKKCIYVECIKELTTNRITELNN